VKSARLKRLGILGHLLNGLDSATGMHSETTAKSLIPLGPDFWRFFRMRVDLLDYQADFDTAAKEVS
jgi:hypothetical protein